MEIKFKDFTPEQTSEETAILPISTYESLGESLADANKWINEESIEITNIETVVLPNMYREDGPDDAELLVSDGDAYWYQFIRVWYKV